MAEILSSKKKIEQIVIAERLYLYNRGLPCGAYPLRQLLKLQGVRPLPSLTTIQRFLSKNHLTHGRTGLYP